MWQHSTYSLFHHLAERTQPSSIFLCPNPCFTWQWLMEFSCASCEKEDERRKKKKKREKSLLQYALSWAIKDDWTFHVPIWRMKTRQIASAPPKIEIPRERDSLCEKLYGIPLNQTQTFTYTLTNHLESVNSSTLCSIRAEVHFKP